MSLELYEFIEKWLNQIVPSLSHPSPDVAPSRDEQGGSTKRRKISHLISPSHSSNSSKARIQVSIHSNNPGTPENSSKRKELHPDDQLDNEPFDANETPRPTKAASSSAIFKNTPSLSSQSNASQSSRRSSPTRAFPVQGYHNNHRLDSVTMDPDNREMPSDLANLLDDMYDFSTARCIIPDILKSEIGKQSAGDRSLRRLRNDVLYSLTTDGSSPIDMTSASRLMLTARKLVRRAGQCHHLQYDEVGWNNLVHTPLLDAVFNYGDPNETRLATFLHGAMTASVSSRFHYFPIPATKVDYVLYLDADAEDTCTSDAIAKLEETAGSVNHTAFTPLASHPISLSIETERHGGDGRRADVQMAAWQAAQWSFLEAHAGGAVKNLTFLPGVIVQGHEWKFVATTRKDNKTTLWSSHQFRITMTLVGVFQIMAGMRRLRRWSVEVFWPWYKKHALHLHEKLRQTWLPCKAHSYNFAGTNTREVRLICR
ncbi:hypothetical protein LCI18_003477 [Fusarium solani-melongenae]|uniref:Uncharacterized protein n=1 Tax=Fusarium solani subsp. cucurbitae TaxID=2747967 RepID=A0ACD3YUG5_FUSSC|nr:hypothetical protein LCI18_003477 [Fusarium solani-melongenae]